MTVTIGQASGRVDLASLVLARGATVRVSAGAGLFVSRDDEADFSLVRADSAIHVSGGTLGGRGQLLVRGLVTLAPEGGRPATLGTSDGPDFPPAGGQLVLDDQGQLRVDPSTDPSSASRITTAYRVEARGTVTITDEALLAADHGTSFALVDRLRRTGAGTLELKDNSGYAEGDGLDGDLPLSTFTNQGVISKSGSGSSRIAADYSASGGSSTEVQDGSLLLPDGTKAMAEVAAGSSYGTGICDLVSEECGPNTSDQVAWLTIPFSEDDAIVGVKLEPDVDGDDALGSVVDARAGIKFSRTSPRCCSCVTTAPCWRSGTAPFAPGATWRSSTSRRTAAATTGCCRARRLAPSPWSEVACVDRRKDAGSSRQVGGDAIMVVLTTETSRWRVP